MKSVMISVKPKWCELMAKGQKTVEVRKTKPKINPPFKCYIYMTKSNLKGDRKVYKDRMAGKVIGEFVCDFINEYTAEFVDDDCYEDIRQVFVDDGMANLGDIESDEFYNLATVIDRLEVYHDDYYFKEFEEKRNPDILSGKILPNLSDGKPFEKYSDLTAICWFITNSEDILSKITPDVVEAFEYESTLNFKDEYNKNTDDECLHYYVRKMLFNLLFETLSIYRVVECDDSIYCCDNSIYCTAYGDAENWKSDKEFYKQIREHRRLRSLYNFYIWLNKNNIYESSPNDNEGYAYCEMLEREKRQIIDDLEDLGKEGHYFDEYAFVYLGLSDEYDKI